MSEYRIPNATSIERTAIRSALALLCAFGPVSAVEAQGIDPPSVQQWVDPAQASSAGKQLPAPVDAAALEKLQQMAETAFQQQQFQDAQIGFTRLVEFDERYAIGWFRLGNLYQRASDLTAATEAYRRVLMLTNTVVADDGLREKALMNLALLGLWRTRLALAELERMSIKPELATERQAVESETAQAEAKLRELSRTRQIDSSLASSVVLSPRVYNASASTIATSRRTPIAAQSSTAAKRAEERAPVRGDMEATSARRWGPQPKVEHFQGMPAPSQPTRSATRVASSAQREGAAATHLSTDARDDAAQGKATR